MPPPYCREHAEIVMDGEAQGIFHNRVCVMEGFCELHSGDNAQPTAESYVTEGGFWWSEIYMEIFYVGEDEPYGKMRLVARESVSYVIASHCVLLIIESEI